MITRLKFVENQLVRTNDCFCDSLLLKNEQVCSFLDMEFNQLLVTCDPSTLLLFINWKCMRVYNEEISALSTFLYTGQILQLPGFSYGTLPFVVCAGSNGLHLVNLSNNYIEILVKAEVISQFGQPAFFF